MNKELFSLLKSSKDELSEEFINNAFDIMIQKDNELIPFINNFVIDDDLESEGEYEAENKIIRISPSKIISNEFGYISDKVTALQCIRHEMEHARGLKRLYEVKHDIESVVNEYSFAYYIQKYGIPSSLFFNDDITFGLSYKIENNYLYVRE